MGPLSLISQSEHMPATLIWPRWGSRRLHHCNWPAQGQEGATLLLVFYPSRPCQALVEAAGCRWLRQLLPLAPAPQVSAALAPSLH